MISLSSLFEADTLIPMDLSGIMVSRITSDSRNVSPDSVYFAISGSKSDGHHFLPEVIQKGVKAIVVEQDLKIPFPYVIRVPNTRRALAYAACQLSSNPSRDLSVIGVTGTNGKTTSTYLLRQTWKHLGISSGLVGTVSCLIGEKEFPSALTTPGPLELQKLFGQMKSDQIVHVAMEISSIALDQFRPWGSHFQVGLFTNLTQDHLDYHRSFEGYYVAKRKFFTDYGLEKAIINTDDPFGQRLVGESRASRTISFSLLSSFADYFASGIILENGAATFRIRGPRGTTSIQSRLVGRHNVYNMVGVFAVLVELGFDSEEVARALSFASGAPGRLERVNTKQGGPLAFVDYAHTPDALLNVLQSLKAQKKKGKLITVFGCGGDRDRTKRPQMALIASQWSDFVILTSDNPRTEEPDAILDDIQKGVPPKTSFLREVDRRKAIHAALSMASPNDIVLVAGKGHENYQIIGEAQFPFDDREVIRDYYRHPSID